MLAPIVLRKPNAFIAEAEPAPLQPTNSAFTQCVFDRIEQQGTCRRFFTRRLPAAAHSRETISEWSRLSNTGFAER
jgi:hypothetical protein